MRDAHLIKRVQDRQKGSANVVTDNDREGDDDDDDSDVNGHSSGDWRRLQSLMMQLRKAANHPFLFPGAERTPSWLPANESIVQVRQTTHDYIHPLMYCTTLY